MLKPAPNAPQILLKKPAARLHRKKKKKKKTTRSTSTSQFIYIRVRRSLLLPTPATAMGPSPATPPSGHMYLIEGIIEDISRYAGATVDWLIKIAHFICDPSGTGQLYTHTTGTSSDWYERDKEASWRQVVVGDLLLPGIYEFESTTSLVTLSKISERHSHSVTTTGSESSASSFRRHIEQRDGGCVVTSVQSSLVVSHLIPKRMGTDGAKEVVTRFVGAQAASDVHRFHPMIGILLMSTLNTAVDHYKLGFYNTASNVYTLHNFETSDPDASYIGVTLPGNSALPPLHLYPVTLSVHGGSEPLPPKGVFDWHYLQCTIIRFGTSEYKHLPSIHFFIHPFKTVDDLDDEFTDNETDPPYPTYRFDRFLEEQWKRHRLEERSKEVAQWASGILSGVD